MKIVHIPILPPKEQKIPPDHAIPVHTASHIADRPMIMFAIENGPAEVANIRTQSHLLQGHDAEYLISALAELKLGKMPIGNGLLRPVTPAHDGP